MPQQYLSHLARIWLLLSQFPSEIPARNDNDVIKACGRELVRQRIWICGSVSWGEKALQQVREPRQAPESPTELVSSSVIDTKTLNTILEHIPNLSQELKAALSGRQSSLQELQLVLEDPNLTLKELKEIILIGQNEAKDKSLSELENSGLDKHSRKKRQYVNYSEKCCNVGCTRKELSSIC